jgi:hypothetical protein
MTVCAVFPFAFAHIQPVVAGGAAPVDALRVDSPCPNGRNCQKVSPTPARRRPCTPCMTVAATPPRPWRRRQHAAAGGARAAEASPVPRRGGLVGRASRGSLAAARSPGAGLAIRTADPASDISAWRRRPPMVSPSARAAKVSAMRCFSTGSASAATSSFDGDRRPSPARGRGRRASAPALARGPGPQATFCGRLGIALSGRAERTRSRIASTTLSPTGRRRTRRWIDHQLFRAHRLRGPWPRLAGGLDQDALFGGAVGIEARRSASGSGRAGPRAGDRCLPARAGSASPAHGRGRAGRAARRRR